VAASWRARAWGSATFPSPMSKPFYITTPIYYPNADPHIGSTYTTTYADTLARHHRALGDRTLFLTGTDEHGEKIAEAAKLQGITPQAFVDRMAERFRTTWDTLGLSYDRFIRTTDADHIRAVQHFWNTIYERGDIELRDYEGRYCVGCERYLTEREMQGGRCEQHGTEPEIRSEANYFFRMSRHFEWWRDELARHPERIEPERFRKEVLATLASGALEDLCITRPRERLEWGIPAPWDAKYTIYVWIDALVNYLTGAGYPDTPGWEDTWSGVHHLIGKDILKPHAIFWPAMLHAAGVPLFSELRVHGYWNLDNQKISKSLGNLVSPLAMKEKYGFEPFRYFLLREMSFGLDGEFSEEAVVRRINADLANDLGNLLNRSIHMLHRYRDGVVPERPAERSELATIAERAVREVEVQMQAFHTQRALAAIWELVSAANKQVEERAPWTLAKEGRDAELDAALYACLEALRIIAVLLGAFLPESSQRMLETLGCAPAPDAQDDATNEVPLRDRARWGLLAPGTRTTKAPPLFPRVETP